MTRKDLLKMITACLLFAAFFRLLTAVLMPKWTDPHSDQVQTRIQAFYRQEKDSHDVIYVGASFAYCGISPLTIWEEQGITGYVFAGTGQKAWMSAYYLEEALKYQSPKVAVLEAGALFDEQEASEGNNRKSIDYMRWSGTKLRAIRTICKNTGESEKEYLFPLLRYHFRWQELGKEDFALGQDTSYYLMGTMCWRATRPAPAQKVRKYEAWGKAQAEAEGSPEEAAAIKKKSQPEEAASLKVGPKCEAAVLRMKEMCEEKGIHFQLVRVPSLSWSLEASQAVQAFADDNGIPYLDLNLCREETGVDWQADTPDRGEHLNILGCRKASSALGRYLKENYEFETDLSEGNKRLWEESAQKFAALSEAYARSKRQ